jgi:hypothetical protein
VSVGARPDLADGGVRVAAFRFEIELTERELARAFVREDFARAGLARLLLAPTLLLLGVVWLATHAGVSRLVGLLEIAYGAFFLVRPFLLARVLVAEQRRLPGAVVLELAEEGLTLTRAGRSLQFPWRDVTAAGRRSEYVWYEVRGRTRAPIPLRLVPDLPALEAFLRERTHWAS